MTYNPNIPNANDLVSVSQGNIKTNFTTADTSYGIDHYAFSDTTSNTGKHKKVTFTQVATPISAAGNLILFGKDNAGSTELWMIRDNDASTETKLTTSKISAPIASNNGVTWLPGGILIQWGRAGSTTVTYPQAFSANAYSIQLTIRGSVSGLNPRNSYVINSSSNTGFTFESNNVNITTNHYFWIAIGPE